MRRPRGLGRFGVSARGCLTAAIAVASIGAIALIAVAYQMALDVRQEFARQTSKANVELIGATRQYYSSTILPILREVGVAAAHDYHDKTGVVPVPATLTKELGNLTLESDGVASYGFVSRYPFRGSTASRQLSPFDTEALAHFETTGEKEFWRVESSAEGDVFKFAAAVHMGESCAACHNAHPNSTKNDWKVGDLRGATSVETRIAHLSPLRQPLTRGYILLMAAVLLTVFGVGGALFSRSRAITERQRFQELAQQNEKLLNARRELRRIALHDSLTGLPNRTYLDKQLERLAQGGESKIMLMHLGLDRFKQINDTLGHAAGDAVLQAVAGQLREIAGRGRFVARIGGDEFALLAPFDGDLEGVQNLAQSIIDMVATPISFEEHECRVGASIGIAAGAEPKAAFVNADVALYRAKEAGRSRVEVFSDAVQTEIAQTKKTADEIIVGLENGEFFPYYQPQFDAETLEIVGVEALARWRHPEKGVLAPFAFLSIAEDLGLDAAIDARILEMALEDRKKWVERGVHIPKVSVNVSFSRLNDVNLGARLQELNFEPGSLSFELLEAVFLDNPDKQFQWTLDTIQEMGVDIEIDDFGTGHASIVSLMKVTPKRLKIDRELVAPIVDSDGQRRLIKAIIEIGRSLDVKVTAEGVETMEHAEILRQLGCDVLQGYGLGRPMPSDALIETVLRKRWRRFTREAQAGAAG